MCIRDSINRYTIEETFKNKHNNCLLYTSKLSFPSNQSSPKSIGLESSKPVSYTHLVATLLHPVKMMSSSEEAITKALKELIMLSGTPLAELQVVHAILKENVRCKLTCPGVSSDHEKLNTAVQDVVGMLAVGGTSSVFASQCLKLMYFSVSNLDLSLIHI